VVSVKPGAPSDSEKIEGATVAIFGIQLGCVGCAYAAMKYARQARLISLVADKRAAERTVDIHITSPSSFNDSK
jgi:hypothetical protein